MKDRVDRRHARPPAPLRGPRRQGGARQRGACRLQELTAGEGLGLAAVEALLLGIPVVAAKDGGGVTDIVPSSGAGRFVSAENPRELANAIADLAGSAENRRLAVAAGAALRRRLDPAVVAERFEAIYRTALEKSRHG